MSVATLRSEPAAGGWAARTHGAARVSFVRDGGKTRLAGLYQRDPLRVLFPDVPEGAAPTAALVTTSGGLVAGDEVAIAIRLEAGAVAQVTASAAEKIYRSTGATTVIAQDLSVGEGAWLEYLPPETILFDGARLARHTTIALAPGAGFLGGGIIVFGRRAHGEGFTHGLLHEEWQVSRDGVLIWGDALHLDDAGGGDIAAIIADPACFDGAASCATCGRVAPTPPLITVPIKIPTPSVQATRNAASSFRVLAQPIKSRTCVPIFYCSLVLKAQCPALLFPAVASSSLKTNNYSTTSGAFVRGCTND